MPLKMKSYRHLLLRLQALFDVAFYLLSFSRLARSLNGNTRIQMIMSIIYFIPFLSTFIITWLYNRVNS